MTHKGFQIRFSYQNLKWISWDIFVSSFFSLRTVLLEALVRLSPLDIMEYYIKKKYHLFSFLNTNNKSYLAILFIHPSRFLLFLLYFTLICKYFLYILKHRTYSYSRFIYSFYFNIIDHVSLFVFSQYNCHYCHFSPLIFYLLAFF